MVGIVALDVCLKRYLDSFEGVVLEMGLEVDFLIAVEVTPSSLEILVW